MNDTARDEVASRFAAAAANQAIVNARMALLNSAGPCFTVCADRLQTFGFVWHDDVALAAALLCHIASELSEGIAMLIAARRSYAAAALLRQLVEVEYLALLGYIEPARLAKWYRSPSVLIRREFTPSKMRRASNGLFADHEYWTHCEHGGHPHPSGRMLLVAYRLPLAPEAHLMPDACHHIRRLWTSLSLAQEQQSRAETVTHSAATAFQQCRARWEALEDELVLSFDGIQDDVTERS
jgi:hypothetical protein